MKIRHLAVLVLFASATGCSTLSNLFSSSTSPSKTAATESFAGSVAVGGNSLFTFTLDQAGTVSVTLTSLGVTSPVGLGIGTPSGFTCTLTSSSPNVTAGTTAQLTSSEAAGSYCVEIFDAGTLSASTTFAITVVHP